MTHPERVPDAPPETPRSAAAVPRRSVPRWSLYVLGIVAAAVVVTIWVRHPASEPPPTTAEKSAAEVVHVAGPQLIAVLPDTPLAAKLDVRSVAAEHVSAPLLTVTGSVVARLATGKDIPEARWDFSQLDLATMYADWLRAQTDEPYAEQQLEKTRQLAAARIAAQTHVVERLRQLVKAGTDAPKDLAKEEADLVQAELDGQKQIFDAELALKNAGRARATLQRQLFQQGIDPELLGHATEGTAIVVADVPEARMGLVHEGQAIEARFVALPGESFPGRVSSVAPTLAAERRTLRVFFELNDPQGHLRPGIFADVSLGTEPRDALLVPSDAILHVGRADYVLVQERPGVWKVVEVRVGETHGTTVEILSGLSAGDTLITSGAILLKPLVVQALQG